MQLCANPSGMMPNMYQHEHRIETGVDGTPESLAVTLGQQYMLTYRPWLYANISHRKRRSAM